MSLGNFATMGELCAFLKEAIADNDTDLADIDSLDNTTNAYAAVKSNVRLRTGLCFQVVGTADHVPIVDGVGCELVNALARLERQADQKWTTDDHVAFERQVQEAPSRKTARMSLRLHAFRIAWCVDQFIHTTTQKGSDIGLLGASPASFLQSIWLQHEAPSYREFTGDFPPLVVPWLAVLAREAHSFSTMSDAEAIFANIQRTQTANVEKSFIDVVGLAVSMMHVLSEPLDLDVDPIEGDVSLVTLVDAAVTRAIEAVDDQHAPQVTPHELHGVIQSIINGT